MEGRQKRGGFEEYWAFKGRKSQMTRALRSSLGLRNSAIEQGKHSAEGTTTASESRLATQASIEGDAAVGRALRCVALLGSVGRFMMWSTTVESTCMCPGCKGFQVTGSSREEDLPAGS